MKISLTLALTILLSSVSLAQEAEAPVAEHEILQKDVGTWTGTMKIYTGGSGSEPISFPVHETNTSFGNGLWVMTEFDAGPMKGRGSFGYDAHNKKFVGTWIDSMHSTLSIAEGQYDKAKDQLVMIYSGTDTKTGEPNEVKAVSTHDGKDKRSFVMYEKKDGQWVQAFTIDYQRSKD